MTDHRAPFRNDIIATTIADPIPHRCSYNSDLGDTGIVRIHCANLVLVGSNDSAAGPVAVSIVIGQQGCGCGCNLPGRAFEYIPTPDQARMLAQHLIDAADAVDAHAAQQAATMLGNLHTGGRS